MVQRLVRPVSSVSVRRGVVVWGDGQYLFLLLLVVCIRNVRIQSAELTQCSRILHVCGKDRQANAMRAAATRNGSKESAHVQLAMRNQSSRFDTQLVVRTVSMESVVIRCCLRGAAEDEALECSPHISRCRMQGVAISKVRRAL